MFGLGVWSWLSCVSGSGTTVVIPRSDRGEESAFCGGGFGVVPGLVWRLGWCGGGSLTRLAGSGTRPHTLLFVTFGAGSHSEFLALWNWLLCRGSLLFSSSCLTRSI